MLPKRTPVSLATPQQTSPGVIMAQVTSSDGKQVIRGVPAIAARHVHETPEPFASAMHDAPAPSKIRVAATPVTLVGTVGWSLAQVNKCVVEPEVAARTVIASDESSSWNVLLSMSEHLHQMHGLMITAVKANSAGSSSLLRRVDTGDSGSAIKVRRLEDDGHPQLSSLDEAGRRSSSYGLKSTRSSTVMTAGGVSTFLVDSYLSSLRHSQQGEAKRSVWSRVALYCGDESFLSRVASALNEQCPSAAQTQSEQEELIDLLEMAIPVAAAAASSGTSDHSGDDEERRISVSAGVRHGVRVAMEHLMSTLNICSGLSFVFSQWIAFEEDKQCVCEALLTHLRLRSEAILRREGLKTQGENMTCAINIVDVIDEEACRLVSALYFSNERRLQSEMDCVRFHHKLVVLLCDIVALPLHICLSRQQQQQSMSRPSAQHPARMMVVSAESTHRTLRLLLMAIARIPMGSLMMEDDFAAVRYLVALEDHAEYLQNKLGATAVRQAREWVQSMLPKKRQTS